MPKFPYYGFNNPFYNNYIFPKKNYTNIPNIINTENTEKSKNTKKENKSNNNFFNFNFDKENYLFDLFGIKLYFDDILILGLLFFLYKEGIKDYELFISLLLLLIS